MANERKCKFTNQSKIVEVAPGKQVTATVKAPYAGHLTMIAYLSGVNRRFKIKSVNKKVRESVKRNEKITVVAQNISEDKASFSMNAIIEVKESAVTSTRGKAAIKAREERFR